MKSDRLKFALPEGSLALPMASSAGAAGSILVPLLTKSVALSAKVLRHLCGLLFLPLCALSVCIYLFRGKLQLLTALPYLMGGLLGGWLGGKLFKGVKVDWLRRLFGLLLLYGGVRCFL